MLKIICITIFLLGYFLISIEHKLKINKTAISVLLGTLLWLVITLFTRQQIEHQLVHIGGNIFELITLLLSAMTISEIITHYGFFDYIYQQTDKLQIKDSRLFFLLTLITFFFSTFINNITTTIIFIYIARYFFKEKNLIIAATGIVIASNAGGVFSPIGDVTSTLLWLNGKYTAITLIQQGFLPALTAFLVSIYFLGKSIKSIADNKNRSVIKIHSKEWIIISSCFISFFLPLLMPLLHLPPYLGLLIGLAIVWLLIDLIKPRTQSSKMDISIEKLFQRADIASLYFFIGILLAIQALQYVGVLDDISQLLFAHNPNANRVITGSIFLGLVSSVLDNIPLTAAVLTIVKTTHTSLWVLLSFTLGFGGSLLSIGSGSGIMAMNMVKGLSFTKYLKIATLPVLLAYFCGIFVWLLQYYFLHL